MRMALTIVLVCVFGSVACAASSAVAAPHRVCGSKGRATLSQSGRARVYAARGVVWLCARGGRASFRLGSDEYESCLGSSSGCLAIDTAATAGPVAAYAVERFGGTFEGAEYTVFVRDARTGAVWSQTSTLDWPHPGTPYVRYDFYLRRLVVAGDGAVAWTSEEQEGGDGPVDGRVLSIGPRCGSRVLDDQARVDSRSLSLRGRTLSWVTGGQTRTAELC